MTISVETARRALEAARSNLAAAEAEAARRPAVHVTEPTMTLDFNPVFKRQGSGAAETFTILRKEETPCVTLGHSYNRFEAITVALKAVDNEATRRLLGNRAVNNMTRRIIKGSVDAKWTEGME